jgi:hypothetical protein
LTMGRAALMLQQTRSTGETIEHIIRMFTTLYTDTGLEYFKAQACAMSQWVWMLPDEKRVAWGLKYKGDPSGADICRGGLLLPIYCGPSGSDA